MRRVYATAINFPCITPLQTKADKKIDRQAKYVHVHTLLVCLSVCLFVSNKRQKFASNKIRFLKILKIYEIRLELTVHKLKKKNNFRDEMLS